VKLLDDPDTVLASVTQPTRVEEPEEAPAEGEAAEGEAAEGEAPAAEAEAAAEGDGADEG
jgi:hypothetical protein